MRTIKVIAGQTLQDIAVIYYGYTEGVMQLITDNDLDLDSELVGGQELIITDFVAPKRVLNVAVIAKTRTATKVSAGQSLIDVALQEYGSVSGLMSLITDNEFSLDTDLVAGQILSIKSQNIINQDLITKFRAENQRINTGILQAPEEISGAILTELGDYLLTEANDKILIE